MKARFLQAVVAATSSLSLHSFRPGACRDRPPEQPVNAKTEPTPPLQPNRARAEGTKESTPGMQPQPPLPRPPQPHHLPLPASTPKPRCCFGGTSLPAQPENAKTAPTPPLPKSRAHAADIRASTPGTQLIRPPAQTASKAAPARVPCAHLLHRRLQLLLLQQLHPLRRPPEPLPPARHQLPAAAPAWSGSTPPPTSITATALSSTEQRKPAST